MADLSNRRKSYERGELIESNVPSNPFDLFADWFTLAESSETVSEANAMTVATSDKNNIVRSRVVLLKSFSDAGFIFYTNYNSKKGIAIRQNPNVSISFFWPSLERQIIIMGKAEKISEAESVQYFHSRPRGSQLGAVASEQSEIVAGRSFLETKLQDFTEKYDDQEIPKPEDWGGYLVKPHSIEFWQGRANRLHDRLEYSDLNGKWNLNRLSP